MPKFVPSEEKGKEMASLVDKEDKKNEVEEEKEEEERQLTLPTLTS